MRNKDKRGIFDRFLDTEYDNTNGYGNPRLHSVHLHFPSERVHPQTLEMLRSRGISFLTDTDFQSELERLASFVGARIPRLYRGFIRKPFSFVRDPEQKAVRTLERKIKTLSELVEVPF